LIAWRPDGASNIARLVAESYEGYREGVWSYSLAVAIPMLMVVEREHPSGPYDLSDAGLLARTVYLEKA
jgi:hypothetical protein